jgi:hypothetical protein
MCSNSLFDFLPIIDLASGSDIPVRRAAFLPRLFRYYLDSRGHNAKSALHCG